MDDAKELVKTLVKEHAQCVLATASLEGKPEAATIEYADDADGNLYFETFTTYRKYPNMKSNPQASVVITKGLQTVQMDGTVTELSGNDAEHAKKRLISKLGKSPGRYSEPEIRFFRFTPTWIRALVGTKWPPKYVLVKG